MQLRAYSANIRAFVTLLSEVFVLVPYYVCKRKIYLYNYGIYVWMTMAFVCVVYTTTTRGRQRLMCAWEILSKDCCTALPPRWESPKIIVENVIFVVKPIMLCVCSDEIYIYETDNKSCQKQWNKLILAVVVFVTPSARRRRRVVFNLCAVWARRERSAVPVILLRCGVCFACVQMLYVYMYVGVGK